MSESSVCSYFSFVLARPSFCFDLFVQEEEKRTTIMNLRWMGALDMYRKTPGKRIHTFDCWVYAPVPLLRGFTLSECISLLTFYVCVFVCICLRAAAAGMEKYIHHHPVDLMEGTKRGSFLSLFALTTIALLFLLETRAFFQTQ
jgi:hypothetical protein